jgi:hypothetical protein
MALVQKRNTQKNMILFGGLGAAAVIAIVVYFTVIAPPASGPVENNDQVAQRDLKIIQDFGEDVLTDPRYQALKPAGDLPINIGNIGRPNPFSVPQE